LPVFLHGDEDIKFAANDLAGYETGFEPRSIFDTSTPKLDTVLDRKFFELFNPNTIFLTRIFNFCDLKTTSNTDKEIYIAIMSQFDQHSKDLERPSQSFQTTLAPVNLVNHYQHFVTSQERAATLANAWPGGTFESYEVHLGQQLAFHIMVGSAHIPSGNSNMVLANNSSAALPASMVNAYEYSPKEQFDAMDLVFEHPDDWSDSDSEVDQAAVHQNAMAHSNNSTATARLRNFEAALPKANSTPSVDSESEKFFDNFSLGNESEVRSDDDAMSKGLDFLSDHENSTPGSANASASGSILQISEDNMSAIDDARDHNEGGGGDYSDGEREMTEASVIKPQSQNSGRQPGEDGRASEVGKDSMFTAKRSTRSTTRLTTKAPVHNTNEDDNSIDEKITKLKGLASGCPAVKSEDNDSDHIPKTRVRRQAAKAEHDQDSDCSCGEDDGNGVEDEGDDGDYGSKPKTGGLQARKRQIAASKQSKSATDKSKASLTGANRQLSPGYVFDPHYPRCMRCRRLHHLCYRNINGGVCLACSRARKEEDRVCKLEPCKPNGPNGEPHVYGSDRTTAYTHPKNPTKSKKSPA
jgi:hypothetical protein